MPPLTARDRWGGTLTPGNLRVMTLPDPTAADLLRRMGIELKEATPERVVGTMPVEGNTQPYGLLHGGASVRARRVARLGRRDAARAGQSAESPSAWTSTPPTTAARGPVWSPASPQPIHRGGTVATYEIVITDEAAQRVCTARLTCALRRP